MSFSRWTNGIMVGRMSLTFCVALIMTLLAMTAALSWVNLFHVRDAYEKKEAILVGDWTILKYGIIDSVDVSKNIVTVRIYPRYQANDPMILVQYLINTETAIAEVSLVKEGDVYTGISPITLKNISDLKSGMTVAVGFYNSTELKKTVARIIVFGNPLL